MQDSIEVVSIASNMYKMYNENITGKHNLTEAYELMYACMDSTTNQWKRFSKKFKSLSMQHQRATQIYLQEFSNNQIRIIKEISNLK